MIDLAPLLDRIDAVAELEPPADAATITPGTVTVM